MSLRVKIKIPKSDVPVRRVEPTLIHIDDLLPHEEIVTERLNALLELIKKLNAVDMPIIAAPIEGTEKYLIVDGHHRWAALKKIGASKVPAIIIDYFDPAVKVYTWYPGFSGNSQEFLDRLKREGLVIEKCEHTIDSLSDEILRKNAFIMLDDGKSCYQIKGSIKEQKKVTEVLDGLNTEGSLILVWYGIVRDALIDLRKGEIDYVLVRRALTKQEIIEIVRQGEVLPPKSTRHILPYVPAKVYTPLKRLM